MIDRTKGKERNQERRFLYITSVLIIWVLCASWEVNAQKKVDYQAGFIVKRTNDNLAGDTLRGFVAICKTTQTSTDFLDKVVWRDGNFKKKRKFFRAQVFAFKMGADVYEIIPIVESSDFSFLDNYYDLADSPKDQDWECLRVITKGQLSHYLLDWSDQGEQRISSMDLIYLQGSSRMARVDLGLFGLKQKVIKTYLSSCQTCASKPAGEKYNSVQEIVNCYNTSCN